jgi:hypothetical protein
VRRWLEAAVSPDAEVRILRGKIIDARGAPRDVCRTRDLPKRATSARVAVFIARDKRPRSIAVFWISIFAVASAFFAAPHILRGDYLVVRYMLIGSVIVYPPLILLAIVLSLLFRSRRLRRAVRACLSEGLCPACGYRIGDIPGGDDGIRLCPECGAAWPIKEHL